jgi:dihydrofolate reductase
MRKVILSIPITLDGYIEELLRERDWVIADDELHNFSTRLLENADLVLSGRVTYTLFVNYWPTATGDPSLSASMRHFARTIEPMQKIVFSKTLDNVSWNTRIYTSVNPEEFKKIKDQPGRDIVLFGGATIVQAFMELGLVNEYQLLLHPVAIGNGRPLFSWIQDVLKMNLLWSQPFQSGAVALCY